MAAATHRIRRQRWLCSAGSPAEAFALRGGLRALQDSAVPAAFERAFDSAVHGDEVVRLPRLELRIRLASVDDLAALPELLARAVSEQLGRLLAPKTFPRSLLASPGREPSAHPDGPASAETAGTRLSGRESRLAGLIEYLETGTLPWELAQAGTAGLLEQFRETAFEDLAAVVARAPDAQASLSRRIAFFFRLFQLLPENRWEEIALLLSLRSSLRLPVERIGAGRTSTGGPAHGLLEALTEALGGPAALAPEITASHCRDAPWGVSEAAAGFPTVTNRPREIEDREPQDAAAETPHGASLQWGGQAAASEPLRPVSSLEPTASTGGPAHGLLEALTEALGGPAALAPEIAASHCRDAPWGVSEAAAGVPTATKRRREIEDRESQDAAAETPHGASLQWGGTWEASLQAAASEPLRPVSSLEPTHALLRGGATETFPIAVRCAGLVVLHPFLPRLFESVGLLRDGDIPWPELPRAAALLHWLATGRDEVHEFELGFVKILLGRRPEEPLLVNGGLLAAGDREEGEALLQAAVQHWRALKGTTPAGLRASFLQRGGLLREDDAGWRLQVEPVAFDLLLDHLPWGIGVVKLPWMTRPIFTEWPATT